MASDEHTVAEGASPREVFDHLEAILRQELDLFGDSMIVDQPSPSSNESVATQKKQSPSPPAPLQSATIAEAQPWASAPSLVELDAQIHDCQKCHLGATRTKFVFGVGNPHATLMVIGEAPGADEDAQGEPFVGRAGQLLNKILEAIQFKREDVYICNILKCRPPGNRKPTPEESATCKPYLKKQIALVQPKVILALGLTAAENLLGTSESLGALRGRVLSYEGIPLMVTYHPAALLRNPNWKRPTWEDVKALRVLHDERVAGTESHG